MEYSYDITQKQRQKLILSAQMRESLDVLQMPLPDLFQKIDEEMMENPVLDLCEPEKSELDRTEDLKRIEFIQKLRRERGREAFDPTAANEREFDPFLFLSEEPTFTDFLMEQLRDMKTDRQTAKICRYLIEDLDDRGYLSEDAATIADHLRMSDDGQVEKAVEVIRSMEPAGVGAFDLQECLTLQLQRKPDSVSAEFEIVNQYLELLADNKIRLIAEKLGVSAPDAQRLCDRIRTLNPIPSSGFRTNTQSRFIIPEATVQNDDSGRWTVEMNRSVERRLSIDPLYRKLARTAGDKETQKYIREKLARASSLIREVSSRSSTILRVLETIIELQPSYFRKGRSGLKPMTMREVAKKLNLNESTVSRAVQEKFILCPFGLVSIKSLFTAQLGNSENTGVSAAKAKERIQNCIDLEDKKAPISDQAIVSELWKQGIVLSRRTVAKYRNELNIPGMAKRKIYR